LALTLLSMRACAHWAHARRGRHAQAGATHQPSRRRPRRWLRRLTMTYDPSEARDRKGEWAADGTSGGTDVVQPTKGSGATSQRSYKEVDAAYTGATEVTTKKIPITHTTNASSPMMSTDEN